MPCQANPLTNQVSVESNQIIKSQRFLSFVRVSESLVYCPSLSLTCYRPLEKPSSCSANCAYYSDYLLFFQRARAMTFSYRRSTEQPLQSAHPRPAPPVLPPSGSWWTTTPNNYRIVDAHSLLYSSTVQIS